MDAKTAANQLIWKNPNASLDDAKRYAEALPHADEQFVKEVMREFFSQKVNIAKSKSDVDRMWPEDKGY